MALLQVKDIRISEEFNAALQQVGITMPLNEHPTELGEIIDATGRKVMQIDPEGVRTDEEVETIALLIVIAVNTCGSFVAALPQEAA